MMWAHRRIPTELLSATYIGRGSYLALHDIFEDAQEKVAEGIAGGIDQYFQR